MIQLLNTYLAEGKIYEALLVGQNLAYKTCNKTNFKVYWDLLIKLAKETDDLVMATKYIDQANSLIAFFAENIEMSEEIVDFLILKKSQLDAVNSDVQQKILKKEQEIITISVNKNTEYLNLISRLANNILDITDEEQFKKRLDQIRSIDLEIKKDFLTTEQQLEYEKLTSQCSQIVAQKTAYFEHKKDVTYNNNAIAAYEKAFNFIKTGKGFEGNQDIFRDIFAYDASKLFSETLIYYNHVYSYIFSKLSDDEKLLFTKAAINSSKKR